MQPWGDAVWVWPTSPRCNTITTTVIIIIVVITIVMTSVMITLQLSSL
jgi:hypothetical protein